MGVYDSIFLYHLPGPAARGSNQIENINGTIIGTYKVTGRARDWENRPLILVRITFVGGISVNAYCRGSGYVMCEW
jgi:hypothetical protein